MNILNQHQLGAKYAGSKKSKLHAHVADELLPKPIKIGGTNGWPEHEIDRILQARVAGATDDQVRALVRELVAARKQAEAA